VTALATNLEKLLPLGLESLGSRGKNKAGALRAGERGGFIGRLYNHRAQASATNRAQGCACSNRTINRSQLDDIEVLAEEVSILNVVPNILKRDNVVIWV